MFTVMHMFYNAMYSLLYGFRKRTDVIRRRAYRMTFMGHFVAGFPYHIFFPHDGILFQKSPVNRDDPVIANVNNRDSVIHAVNDRFCKFGGALEGIFGLLAGSYIFLELFVGVLQFRRSVGHRYFQLILSLLQQLFGLFAFRDDMLRIDAENNDKQHWRQPHKNFMQIPHEYGLQQIIPAKYKNMNHGFKQPGKRGEKKPNPYHYSFVIQRTHRPSASISGRHALFYKL